MIFTSARSGFTLVEILIVVVILGILASIVVPRFTEASEQARNGTTFSELQKLRRHLDIYRARNAGAFPTVVADSDGDWGQLVGRTSEYLQGPPLNSHVGGSNGRKIVFGSGPDTAFQTNYGWIFDPNTGQVWAGAFGSDDQPLNP
jgi:prepilin-type N-terminal cleavage/methylation domain-containing protein